VGTETENKLQEPVIRQRLNRKEHGLGKVLLSFFGSMELAITLFVVVGIASVIGTVLQQNQAYNSYIIKFGTFWFEVFKSLQMYDIYSAWWFMALLAFLLISTSVCIYHNAPFMLREWRNYRLSVSSNSLALMHSSGRWTSQLDTRETVDFITTKLQNGGYRYKSKQQNDIITIAAKKGTSNRLGYLFTHSAIVVICLGALYDGNFNLKLKELSGQLKPETRDLYASQVPDISRLSADQNHAFRANASIPEGTSTGIGFLQLRNGYLVQELPFIIELKDFRLEHYPSGMPKSYESDVVIYDKHSNESIEKTIKVNHPLVYKDYTIYQASFEDGGSILNMLAWSLTRGKQQIMEISQKVGDNRVVPTPEGDLKLELMEFQLFNVKPNPKAEETGRKFINYGPSYTYRLRDSSGQAKEFFNYMNPVEQEGRYFYLSGIRSSAAEPFRYLFIPADDKNSIKRFMDFRKLLNDPQAMDRIAKNTASLSIQSDKTRSEEQINSMAVVMQSLAELFNQGGYDRVLADIEAKVPENMRDTVTDSYFKVLQTILGTAYLDLLEADGVNTDKGITLAQEQFYNDVVNTMGVLASYNAPFYLQLKSFEHKQASGFQITKAPGKNIVYFGCILLCIGIALMFYVAHKRIWVIVDSQSGKTQILAAGSGDRHQKEFALEFKAFSQLLDKQFEAIN
jgi:cytochrome c biogenesis protein